MCKSSREQRPIQQYGSSEAIASCAWSSHLGAPLLVAGMGNKYLRAFDIRGKDGNVFFAIEIVTKIDLSEFKCNTPPVCYQSSLWHDRGSFQPLSSGFLY